MPQEIKMSLNLEQYESSSLKYYEHLVITCMQVEFRINIMSDI